MSDKCKYLVEAEVTISLHAVVEASSTAEAKRIAADRGYLASTGRAAATSVPLLRNGIIPAR